jgi:hypothetical protein
MASIASGDNSPAPEREAVCVSDSCATPVVNASCETRSPASREDALLVSLTWLASSKVCAVASVASHAGAATGYVTASGETANSSCVTHAIEGSAIETLPADCISTAVGASSV